MARRHGQSPRAIERLWNLIIQPTVNVSCERSVTRARGTGVSDRVSRARRRRGHGLVDRPAFASCTGKMPNAHSLKSGVTRARPTRQCTSIARPSDGTFNVLATEDPFIFDALIVATAPRVAATLGACLATRISPRGWARHRLLTFTSFLIER